MVYILDKIQTATDCDQLIEIINREMDNLVCQETMLERKQKACTESATEIQLQLTNPKNELVGLKSLINGVT